MAPRLRRRRVSRFEEARAARARGRAGQRGEAQVDRNGQRLDAAERASGSPAERERVGDAKQEQRGGVGEQCERKLKGEADEPALLAGSSTAERSPPRSSTSWSKNVAKGMAANGQGGQLPAGSANPRHEGRADEREAERRDERRVLEVRVTARSERMRAFVRIGVHDPVRLSVGELRTAERERQRQQPEGRAAHCDHDR